MAMFEIRCDCGFLYDAELQTAVPVENGRLLWLCPACGFPSMAVRHDGPPAASRQFRAVARGFAPLHLKPPE